ncbi:MAG TPA: hypothetical protein VLD86_03565 [Ilumatobacteraceae bacterium]|nr:hypothetical protein [Ilumatobacteraceae bacterium]
MNKIRYITFVAALGSVIALAACGGGSYGSSPQPTAKGDQSPAVTVSDNPVGKILAGDAGRTVYAFTDDANGTSTCVDGCAAVWPPVIVDGSVDLGALPDSASFSVVNRPDGSKQLKAGKWPLYYFAGDAAAGDVNGQGSGGKWFVLGPDATLIK